MNAFVLLAVLVSQNPTDAVTPPAGSIEEAQQRDAERQETYRRWDLMTTSEIESELGWMLSDWAWWLATGRHPRVPSRYYHRESVNHGATARGI